MDEKDSNVPNRLTGCAAAAITILSSLPVGVPGTIID